MAKFLSHIVTEASGSVGNTVYAKGRGGSMTMRKKGIPTQPHTVSQQNQRTAFAGASQAWRGLTDAQRAGWTALGKQMTHTDSLGQASTLTGSQAYVALNGTQGAAAPLSDAPSQPETVTPLPGITLAASRTGSATGAFSLAVQSAAYTGKVQVYASPAVSAGRSHFGTGDYRLLEVVPNLSAGSTSLTAAYVAKYGTPTVGTKIALKLVPCSPSGFKGGASVATAIVSVGT